MEKRIDWKKYLRRIGEKVTVPRILILASLDNLKSPMSADDLILKTKLDKATVYRVLDFLTKKSIVRLIDLRQGKRLYELSSHCDHHHVVCTKCKKIAAIDICVFKNLSKQVLEKSNFSQINDHSMEFFGVCKKCVKERNDL
jgi:Fur family transcriptional regulator, ferric uptake regulator